MYPPFHKYLLLIYFLKKQQIFIKTNFHLFHCEVEMIQKVNPQILDSTMIPTTTPNFKLESNPTDAIEIL